MEAMSNSSKNKRDVDDEFVKEERERKGGELDCANVGLIER